MEKEFRLNVVEMGFEPLSSEIQIEKGVCFFTDMLYQEQPKNR